MAKTTFKDLVFRQGLPDRRTLLTAWNYSASKNLLVGSGSLLKKSRIRETMNLSTDADHRTDIFFGGDGKKKQKKT